MEEYLDAGASAEDTALVTVLGALGDEFLELGRFAENLQSVMSPALLRLADDPDCHRNVQMLDLLSQRLNALSSFVCSLGNSMPDTWRINAETALKAVTLSDLAWRLQGIQTAEEHHQAGRLEMF